MITLQSENNDLKALNFTIQKYIVVPGTTTLDNYISLVRASLTGSNGLPEGVVAIPDVNGTVISNPTTLLNTIHRDYDTLLSFISTLE